MSTDSLPTSEITNSVFESVSYEKIAKSSEFRKDKLIIHFNETTILNTLLHLSENMEHARNSIANSTATVTNSENWLDAVKLSADEEDDGPEVLDESSIAFLGLKVARWDIVKEQLNEISELIIISEPIVSEDNNIYIGITNKNKILLFVGKGEMYIQDAIEYQEGDEDPKVFLGDALLASVTLREFEEKGIGNLNVIKKIKQTLIEAGTTNSDKLNYKLLTAFMVDGLYTPSCQELVQLIKKQDMPKLLEISQISDADLNRPNTLTITFNNSEEAHLFALALVAKGFENNLFTNGPSDDFYENKPLENFRVDGNQLALNEEAEGDRSKATLRLNYSNDYDASRKEKYTELVRQVIKETMPHLSDMVKDFRFV